MDDKEKNLKRLSRTSIPINFVKKNNAEWDHEAWLGLCDKLEEKKYTPIDLEKVGELLAVKKAAFLEKKKK